jgi:signal transduction histidine kinase
MATTLPKIEDSQSPSFKVVRRIGLFYSVLTWFFLVLTSLLAFFDATRGYWFIIPAILYGLLIYFFPKLRYQPGQGFIIEWQTSIYWRSRYYKPFITRILFVAVSLGLITWMNYYNGNFVSLYFVLFGHTIGLLDWKLGVPAYLIEFFVLLVVNGLFDPNTTDYGGLIGLSISCITVLPTVIIIVALIKTRHKSEELIQELTATKAQLEEALVHEKEVAVLRERDRMAREMHDVLGHALVLVAVKIEAAQRLQTVNPERAANELEATKELVRQSMTDLRASLAELRSPALADANRPLAQALQEWAARTAGEGHFAIECNFGPDLEKLPVPVQDVLWRVGREAVLNIVKHARAKNVELNLGRKDNQVLLSVADDGVGIPRLAEGQARLEIEGHYGMRGMRERLETLGGHLTVRPNPSGQGTLVLASIPLPPPEESPPEHLKRTLFSNSIQLPEGN